MMTTLTKKEFRDGLKDPKTLKKALVHGKLREFYSEVSDKIWKYSMKYEKNERMFRIKIHYNFNVGDSLIVKLIKQIFSNHSYYRLIMNYYSSSDHEREFWIKLT